MLTQLCKERDIIHADSIDVESNRSSRSGVGMKSWYVVHTKSRCEFSAFTSLDRHGVEVFLPMLREQKVLRGKCHSTTLPLFPRYLFAKFDVSSQLRAVTYARGVKSIVTFGSGPSMVDESIIHAIRSQLTEGVIELSEDRFSPGQVVRIQKGPLCGLEAVFEQKLDGTSRAVLLLKAMSFQARVIIESQHVVNL